MPSVRLHSGVAKLSSDCGGNTASSPPDTTSTAAPRGAPTGDDYSCIGAARSVTMPACCEALAWLAQATDNRSPARLLMRTERPFPATSEGRETLRTRERNAVFG